MAENESPDRRATWVALRTLRQRPTVVGRTERGEPVYEIRSVRLVLGPGAGHFNRLVQCAKCGREVAGAPVLAPAELDRAANPVFCERCARTAAPVVPDPLPAADSVPVPETEPTPAPDRLAAVEAELAETRAQLREVVEWNRELAARQGEIGRQVRDLAAAHDAVEAIQASVDEGASRVHALEQKFQAHLERLTRAVEAPAGAPVPSALMESLEQQLAEAEERLGQR